MPPKHPLAYAAVAFAILSTLSCAARSQPLNAKVDVECDAFQKNPNGSWTLNRKTVVDAECMVEFLNREHSGRTTPTSSASTSPAFSSKTVLSLRKASDPSRTLFSPSSPALQPTGTTAASSIIQ